MKPTRPIFFRLTALFILVFGITACSPAALVPTATALPTDTPAPTATPIPTLPPADLERPLTVNDVERSYLLHIPPGLDNDQPAAVVIVFHGFGSDPKFMQAMTGFNDTSDTNGFLVAYPSGIGRSWNAGRCCGTAQTQNIDEPAFVQAMLEDIATIVRVDPKRVYATGFSNGGMLSYRLGCEMSGTFAAIAPVGGAMTYSPCEPQEPVSVFHVHAMNDADVRYEGGGFPSVEEGLKTWVSINECTDPAQTEEQLDGQLTHTTYASCRNDTAIELYAFKTGGHAWPSLYIWDASQFMWDFFATHPKP